MEFGFTEPEHWTLLLGSQTSDSQYFEALKLISKLGEPDASIAIDPQVKEIAHFIGRVFNSASFKGFQHDLLDGEQDFQSLKSRDKQTKTTAVKNNNRQITIDWIAKAITEEGTLEMMLKYQAHQRCVHIKNLAKEDKVDAYANPEDKATTSIAIQQIKDRKDRWLSDCIREALKQLTP